MMRLLVARLSRPRGRLALAYAASAGGAAVLDPPAPRVVEPDEPRRQAPPDTGTDAWPHTSRVLPWGLAAFLAMLCLIPFDNIELAISSPVDLTLDRVALAPLALLWLLALLVGAHRPAARLSSPFTLAVCAFLAIVVLSIVVNLPRLNHAFELNTSVKSLALIASYLLFLVMVATIVRPEEVRPFGTLFVALASIASLGTIYEYRLHVNEFYSLAATVFSPFAIVGSPPVAAAFERSAVVGPTSHGLAMVVLATLALPFAVVGLLERTSEFRRIALMVATALLLAGAMATLRRTAGIMPVAALGTLFLLRPRSMLRLLPFGIALVLVLQVVTPGALGSINSMLTGGTLQRQQSVTGRIEDYDAVGPDVWSKPLLGRGYGTYDPKAYRFLDNQYLGLMISVGFAGLLAYLGMLVGLFVTCWRTIRAGPSELALAAVAAVSGAVAFYVSSFTFDVLAFPQAPYLFFFVSGLALVSASATRRLRSKPALNAEAER